MKSLYEPAKVEEVKLRIAHLRPESERQWGKMTAAQMLAHCVRGMEWAVGDTKPPRMFVGRILGVVVKRFAVGNDEPMRPNSPTAPDLLVHDHPDLEVERERLYALIDRFAAAGPSACTRHPHSFFGPLTPDEWANLNYKHLDHHLRQFGV